MITSAEKVFNNIKDAESWQVQKDNLEAQDIRKFDDGVKCTYHFGDKSSISFEGPYWDKSLRKHKRLVIVNIAGRVFNSNTFVSE